ncbi:MAG: nitrous oxide reductase family maturation protein NosD, partial [Proteobacteria bacterium]|nr:nitrous oxide reductase family maturation protein NosD [Pseudomonadota bacterium]
MSPVARAVLLALAVALPGAASEAARAAVLPVEPGRLQDVVAHAAPGDVLRLVPGIHHGNVTIDTPGITLEGQPGAVIDGGGQGRTIWVRAPDVTLRRLTIRHSGLDLPAMDAAVFLDKAAA